MNTTSIISVWQAGNYYTGEITDFDLQWQGNRISLDKVAEFMFEDCSGRATVDVTATKNVLRLVDGTSIELWKPKGIYGERHCLAVSGSLSVHSASLGKTFCFDFSKIDGLELHKQDDKSRNA